MNIVIVGAGGVGRYIASQLSKEEYNVILVDPDEKQLEKATFSMDVGTRQGSGTDWQLLDQLLELSPDFFIALTSMDEINLASCAIAKHLGYLKTIARVRDSRFLNRVRLDFAKIFEVDHFIGPELLVANDILKYMVMPGSLAVENFAHGAVQLRSLLVPETWHRSHVPLSALNLPAGVIVGLIRREETRLVDGEKEIYKTVIFPHGNDVILCGDEVTFVGEAEVVSQVHEFLGLTQKRIRSVVIVGGSMTGVNLAKLLDQQQIDVRMIEKDYERCRFLTEELPNTTVIHHDATDLEFLWAEKVGSSDAIIGCTERDEVNILTCMLGKEVGCQEAVTILTNTSYVPLLANLGISYTVSPRISTSDHIMSQILGGKITTLVSFYENQAEIMEVTVSPESKVIGISLNELGPMLPKDLLIAMIENRGRIMVAHGNRIISPGDTVIVITHPKHVKELENLF